MYKSDHALVLCFFGGGWGGGGFFWGLFFKKKKDSYQFFLHTLAYDDARPSDRNGDSNTGLGRLGNNYLCAVLGFYFYFLFFFRCFWSSLRSR